MQDILLYLFVCISMHSCGYLSSNYCTSYF